MSFPRDKKGHNDPALDATAEDERRTFGQQSPYASHPNSPLPVHPESTAGPARTASVPPSPVIPTASPSAPAPATMPGAPQARAQPYRQDNAGPQDGHAEAPPTYEEVTRARSPQRVGGDNNTRMTDPSAPLLGGNNSNSNNNRTTPYTSIPVPPLQRSGSPVNSGRASRCNKLWLYFFVFVLLMLIVGNSNDEEDWEDQCSGRIRFHEKLSDISLNKDVDQFSVKSTGLVSHVYVEQAQEEGPVLGATRIVIQAAAAHREDVHSILHVVKEDTQDRSVKATITRNGRSNDPECLRVSIKIIFPPTMTSIRSLDVGMVEGNLTINLLESQPQLQIKELISRITTGHSVIRAKVSDRILLGVSVGSLKGEVVVGKQLTANLVQGNIALNIIQDNPESVLESKITAINGHINVGLPQPYEGFFQLSTVDGKSSIDGPDPEKIHVEYRSKETTNGWISYTGTRPMSPASNLKLATTDGNVALALERITV